MGEKTVKKQHVDDFHGYNPGLGPFETPVSTDWQAKLGEMCEVLDQMNGSHKLAVTAKSLGRAGNQKHDMIIMELSIFVFSRFMLKKMSN